MIDNLDVKQRMPIVTFSIIVICCLVYLQEVHVNHGFNITPQTLLDMGATNRLIIKQQIWRAFTSMWLHVTPSHLLFNMFFLYMVGNSLENVLGHLRFLAVYLLSGIIGDIASAVFSKSNVVSAGASTALFGLVGVGLIISVFHPSLRYLGSALWSTFIANIIYDLFQPSISLSGHLGGFVGGIILGLILRPPVNVSWLFNSFLVEFPLASLVTAIVSWFLLLKK